MKLILRSKYNILDKDFLEHLIKFFPNMIFVKSNMRKISSIDKYLQETIFLDKHKYSAKQAINVVLKNIVYKTDGKTAIIEIDSAAIFPFYTFKVKDIAKLIDNGNLEIKGTHIFSELFSYIKDNMLQLRTNYEMGIL